MKSGWVRIIAFLLATLFVVAVGWDGTETAGATGSSENIGDEMFANLLSPIWNNAIRRWSPQIYKEAKIHGVDPDLIAAVMYAESNGLDHVVSYAGAVGLMGVMPTGPGLEWRPSAEKLQDPDINMSWGVAILSDVIRQSGGDLTAALAAYSGGWDQATKTVPKAYAAGVLDDYGRAVAARSNVSPNIASSWTVATEFTRGNIPSEKLLMNKAPVSGLIQIGEHIVLQSTDTRGRTYLVRGYAVPLALVVPLENDQSEESSHTVDQQLMARLGLSDAKDNDSNPRVILACLPSLDRLRGRLATRWFSPSTCPDWHP